MDYKKMMTVAGALICASAMAGVESSVVGYQNVESVSGFNFVAPTFTSVGANTVNIQDIKLNPETATSWSDNLQILDEGGATSEIYTYATADESGLESDGWVNEEGTALVDVSLSSGLSVLISTDSETTITFAGSVDTNKIEVTSVSGFNFIGNTKPVAFDIQQIKLDPATATSWTDNIQILDEGGATSEIYTYATSDESGLDADGWVNEEGTALVSREITAGLGVLVSTENEGVTITIPGLTL